MIQPRRDRSPRPLARSRYAQPSSAGLTRMFVFMLVFLAAMTWVALWNLDLGGPGPSRLTRAIGAGAPTRIREGHDPAAAGHPIVLATPAGQNRE